MSSDKASVKTENKLHSLLKTPSGITGLDEITLGGLPQGRPTLICGSAGCGKTLFSLEFIVRGAQEFAPTTAVSNSRGWGLACTSALKSLNAMGAKLV